MIDELITMRGRLEDLADQFKGLLNPNDEDVFALLEEARQNIGQAISILKGEK